MTVRELIERLQVTAGYPLTVEQCLDYINDIQRRICQSDNYYFMETDTIFTTVPSVASYPLPEDFKDERSVVLIDGNDEVPLKPVSPHVVALMSDKVGKPQFYRYDNEDKIVFFPVPDGEYTIMMRYYRFLPDITANDLNESPFLVRRFPELLLAGAKARALEDIGELTLATNSWQHYQALMAQLTMQHIDREFPTDFALIPSNSPFKDIRWR